MGLADVGGRWMLFIMVGVSVFLVAFGGRLAAIPLIAGSGAAVFTVARAFRMRSAMT
jgi:hypothetical protein